MTGNFDQPYWRRLLIAFVASSILVFACSLSMQLHALRDPQWVLAVAVGVAAAAIPGSVIAAFAFRRNLLMLILGSQVLTVTALASWFSVRA